MFFLFFHVFPGLFKQENLDNKDEQLSYLTTTNFLCCSEAQLPIGRPDELAMKTQSVLVLLLGTMLRQFSGCLDNSDAGYRKMMGQML